MKLIVGLGNPGKQYLETRHNVGFKAVDTILDALKVTLNKEKFNGAFVKINDLVIAKPLTFMNLSGHFIKQLANFFQIAPLDILVIYDEINLPVGQIKLKQNSSAGGHKGMQSVIDQLGTQDIPRIKIGIGHPLGEKDIRDHVLSNFLATEVNVIASALLEVKDIALRFPSQNFDIILSQVKN